MNRVRRFARLTLPMLGLAMFVWVVPILTDEPPTPRALTAVEIHRKQILQQIDWVTHLIHELKDPYSDEVASLRHEVKPELQAMLDTGRPMLVEGLKKNVERLVAEL